MLELMSPWEYTRRRPAGARPRQRLRLARLESRAARGSGARCRRSTSCAAAEGLSLVEVYMQGREREDLYQLAEALTDLDEWATTWRVRHFMVVERIIGGEVVGTQGTPVELLGKLVDRKLYPELWKVRTELTNKAIGGRRLSRRRRRDWGGADLRADRGGVRCRSTSGIVDELAPRPGERLLDLAMRHRRRSRCSRRARGAEVTGLDISADQLAKARGAAADEGLVDPLRRGRRQELPYGDASFDVVASAFGIIFAPDHAARGATSWRASCRPGGRIAVDRLARRRLARRAGPAAAAPEESRTPRWTGAARSMSRELLCAALRPRVRRRATRRIDGRLGARRSGSCSPTSVPPLKRWLADARATTSRASAASGSTRSCLDGGRLERHVRPDPGRRGVDATRSSSSSRQLIRLDTVNPPGNETHRGRAAARVPRAVRRRVRALRAGARSGRTSSRGSAGRGEGPSLLLLSHTDTVLADPAEWSVDPWSGELRDGCVWGRGALDMKGQVAANAVAIASLAREGFRPSGDLIFAATADEEMGEDEVYGLEWLCEAHPEAVRCDYAVNEGAGDRVEIGGRVLYLARPPRSAARRSRSASTAGAGTARCRGSRTTRSSRRRALIERLGASRPSRCSTPEVEGFLRALLGRCPGRRRRSPSPARSIRSPRRWSSRCSA